MWQLVRRGLEILLAPFLKATWAATSGWKKPSPFMEGVGNAILLGAGCYALFNVYTCIRYGVVYRLARRGGSGWIAYDDSPVSFVFWTFIYSLPLLIGVLLIWGYFSRRQEAKKATLRQFSEGLGPPPITRSINDR
jgi:hypothetical protein